MPRSHMQDNVLLYDMHSQSLHSQIVLSMHVCWWGFDRVGMSTYSLSGSSSLSPWSTYMSGTPKPFTGRVVSTVFADMTVTDISSAAGIQGKFTHSVDWTSKYLGSVLPRLRVNTSDATPKSRSDDIGRLETHCHTSFSSGNEFPIFCWYDHHSSGSSNVHTSQACDLFGSGNLTVQSLCLNVCISCRITSSMPTSGTVDTGPICWEDSTKLPTASRSSRLIVFVFSWPDPPVTVCPSRD